MPIPNEVPPQPGNCANDHDKPPCTPPLPDNQFNNVVRAINKVATPATVEQIEVVFTGHLARLKMRPRNRMAVAGVPAGSDNIDPQSLYAWAAKIQRTDAEACLQLQQLCATAAVRMGK